MNMIDIQKWDIIKPASHNTPCVNGFTPSNEAEIFHFQPSKGFVIQLQFPFQSHLKFHLFSLRKCFSQSRFLLVSGEYHLLPSFLPSFQPVPLLPILPCFPRLPPSCVSGQSNFYNFSGLSSDTASYWNKRSFIQLYRPQHLTVPSLSSHGTLHFLS